jgi:hypothetical protein
MNNTKMALYCNPTMELHDAHNGTRHRVQRQHLYPTMATGIGHNGTTTNICKYTASIGKYTCKRKHSASLPPEAGYAPAVAQGKKSKR